MKPASLQRLVTFAICALAWMACASGPPPLQPLDREIELERFMGDWYVLAHIPIDVPFVGEANAYNAIESYALEPDGIIATRYTFREGAFDGEEQVLTPRGWVHDEQHNTEWRMQFLWPFRAAYLIAWVDRDYTRTIIGVPSRSYVWIMAREPTLPEAEFDALLERVRALGYDPDTLRIVPQRWPEEGSIAGE